MTKKNEFSDLVQDIDRKFNEIEAQKLKKEARLKKLKEKEQSPEVDQRKVRLKEKEEMNKFLVREKLTYGLAVFMIGQVMLLSVCFKNPAYFIEIWAYGTFSLCIICIAVIDYS